MQLRVIAQTAQRQPSGIDRCAALVRPPKALKFPLAQPSVARSARSALLNFRRADLFSLIDPSGLQNLLHNISQRRLLNQPHREKRERLRLNGIEDVLQGSRQTHVSARRHDRTLWLPFKRQPKAISSRAAALLRLAATTVGRSDTVREAF
jgi:hypothetical protein